MTAAPATELIARGTLVRHGTRLALVWQVEAGLAVLLPVVSTPPAFRHDVALPSDIADTLGRPSAVVRTSRPHRVAVDQLTAVRPLTGPTLCRVVLAMIRVAAEAELMTKWRNERAHRDRAMAEMPGVNLLA